MKSAKYMLIEIAEALNHLMIFQKNLTFTNNSILFLLYLS